MDNNVSLDKLEAAAKAMIDNLGKFGTLREMKGINDAELEAVYSMGVNFYKAGNYDDAEKIFRFLVMFEHTSSRFWTAFGSLNQAKKNIDKALECYQMASFLDLHNPRPMYYAAECFLVKGDRINALKALASLEAYAPKEQDVGRKFLAKGAKLKALIEAPAAAAK